MRLNSLMAIAGLGQVSGPLAYVPDLAPVGSKATYWPRSVAADAEALNYLGFLPDQAFSELIPSMGSQSADIANEAGGFDPLFRAAVTRFQASAGTALVGPADSWIGPNTRKGLAAKVAAKNLGLPPMVIPNVPVPVFPGQVPAAPAVLPGVRPASAQEVASQDKTGTYLAYGAAAAAVLGLGYWALSA